MPEVRHWSRISLLVFLAAIALGLVAAHTRLIQPDDLRLDRVIQTDTRGPALTPVMTAISDIASPVGGVVILGLWTGWLLLVRRRPVTAVSTFLVVAVGWNSSELAKVIVARHRPPAVYSLQPEIGSDSFPSGHVAFTVSAMVAAYFLARGTRWQRPVAVAGAVTVAVVAFDRLYIGAHYPTDVLGSVLVSGAAITALTGVWHRWLLPRLDRVPLLARFGLVETAGIPPLPGRTAAERSVPGSARRPTGARVPGDG
jgi:membrane-associated phospholipid phosphatase